MEVLEDLNGHWSNQVSIYLNVHCQGKLKWSPGCENGPHGIDTNYSSWPSRTHTRRVKLQSVIVLLMEISLLSQRRPASDCANAQADMRHVVHQRRRVFFSQPAAQISNHELKLVVMLEIPILVQMLLHVCVVGTFNFICRIRQTADGNYWMFLLISLWKHALVFH